MTLFSKGPKAKTCALPCRIIKWAILVLLAICMLASVVSVYFAHVYGGALHFGSVTQALSIMSFAVCSYITLKVLVICVKEPCEACSA